MKPLRFLKFTLNNQDGSILVQLLIASALIGIVGLTSAHLSASTKQIEVMGDISNSVNQSFLIALQKSRNASALFEAFNGSPSFPQILDLSPNSPYSRCLRGTPDPLTNCLQLNQPSFSQIPAWTETISVGTNRQVEIKASYRLVCLTATSCQEIQLRIEARQTSGDIRRSADLKISGESLVDMTEISFSCADSPSDQLVTGINFINREAICGGTPLITFNCTNNLPITDINAGSVSPQCASLVAASCPNGMTQVGLMDSQSNCLP